METNDRNSLIRYPLQLQPAVCEHIWGGTNLIDNYNKTTDKTSLSESWEVSINSLFPSIIANGIYKGKTLKELIDEFPEILGKHSSNFSLLVKLINSKSLLSIQVHPDDIYALANEGELGKTEAWFVLDAEEGAFIYLGFKENVTRQQFSDAITDGSVEKLLNKIEVKPGHSFVVEAGTVHAIGGGITLLEVQENSSITYRAYDYKRLDINGQMRELHIDKALQVTNLNKLETTHFKQFNTYLHGKMVRVIALCNYFTSYYIHGGISFGFKEPATITVTGGEGCVISKGESINVIKGDSLFIPAGLNCRVMGSIRYVLTIEGDK